MLVKKTLVLRGSKFLSSHLTILFKTSRYAFSSSISLMYFAPSREAPRLQISISIFSNWKAKDSGGDRESYSVFMFVPVSHHVYVLKTKTSAPFQFSACFSIDPGYRCMTRSFTR